MRTREAGWLEQKALRPTLKSLTREEWGRAEGLGANRAVWRNVPVAHTEGPAEAGGTCAGYLRAGARGLCPRRVVGLGGCSRAGPCGVGGAARWLCAATRVRRQEWGGGGE